MNGFYRSTRFIRDTPLEVSVTTRISRLALGITICFALTWGVNAQTAVEKSSGAISPGQAKTNAIPQTAELKEAEDLGARVVELYADGKFDEALRLAKRVLDIREKALGTEHVLVDETLYNLAEIYIAKGKYKDAETFYQRLLARFEKLYGPRHIKTAPVIQALGYLAYRREDLMHAEILLLRARAIFEKLQAPYINKVASLTLDLADIYRVKGDFLKANEWYLQAVELSGLFDDRPSQGALSFADRALDAYQCFLYETKGTVEAAKILKLFFKSRKKPKNDDGSEVADEFLNGRALELPKPPYPTWAMKYGEQGTVLVRVKIDEGGNVVDAWAVCGPKYLRDVSVKAARKARFSPALFKGKPGAGTGVINYNFGLYRR